MTESERDDLAACAGRLSMLHRLAQALAGSVEPEDIVTAAWAELPSLIGADAAGLVLVHSKQVWTWAKPGDRGRADVLRSRLLNRFDLAAGWKTSSSKPRRLLRRAHLSLVPKSDAPAQPPDDRTLCVHEVPMAVGLHGTGMLYVERSGGHPFADRETQMLATGAALLGLAMGSLHAQRQLQETALRDSLTGVLNRRGLEAPLCQEFNAGCRYGTSACLMLLDLDYFTTVNERLDHAAGDAVLRRVARLVQNTVREVDRVGRYSGEQFAVILPHTDVGNAQRLAERIRAEIERHAFEVEGGQVRLTASLGVASLRDAAITAVDHWVAAAHAALREAKAQGRNRVATHTASSPAPAQAARLRAA